VLWNIIARATLPTFPRLEEIPVNLGKETIGVLAEDIDELARNGTIPASGEFAPGCEEFGFRPRRDINSNALTAPYCLGKEIPGPVAKDNALLTIMASINTRATSLRVSCLWERQSRSMLRARPLAAPPSQPTEGKKASISRDPFYFRTKIWLLL
jgi:hypothetical protein